MIHLPHLNLTNVNFFITFARNDKNDILYYMGGHSFFPTLYGRTVEAGACQLHQQREGKAHALGGATVGELNYIKVTTTTRRDAMCDRQRYAPPGT